MTDQSSAPKLLWKYRKWNDHARAMIENEEVKFSRLSDFNDPFEGACLLRFPSDSAELDRYVREVLAQQHPGDSTSMRTMRYGQLRKEIQEIAERSKGSPIQYRVSDQHGVFSAADHCDDVLMWSHYGHHHRGVSIAVLPDRFAPKVFLPIQYVQSIPVIRILI